MSISSIPHPLVQHLDHARELANSVLNPANYAPRSNTHQTVYVPYFGTPFYQHHYHHFDNGFNTRSFRHVPTETPHEHKRDKADQTLALIGLVATGIMLYTAGSEISTYNNASRDIAQVEKDKAFAQLEMNQYYTSELTKRQVNHLFDLEKELLESYQTDSGRSLFVKTAILTGSAAMTYGYYVGAGAFISVGAGVAIAGSLGWALHAGLSSTDNTKERLARDMLYQINCITG